MCEYCKIEENGDISDDCKELIEQELKLVWDSPMSERGITVLARVRKEVSVFVGISGSTGQLSMLMFDETIEDADPLIEFSQKISYCPMCGRKL